VTTIAAINGKAPSKDIPMQIVLIEQDPNNLEQLKTNLVRWGFSVSATRHSDEALDLIGDDPVVDMVICDWGSVFGGDGAFLQAIHDIRKTHYVYLILRKSPVAAMSGAHSDPELVDDVVDKTLDDGQLLARITLGARIAAMENESNQKHQIIKNNYYQTIQLLIQLIGHFDETLGGHCRRVATMALEIAQRYPEIKTTDYPAIEAAASLHDIGFIGLPKDLIAKSRTAMTGDDLQLYQSHPERGEKALNQIDFLRSIARIVRQHHEQYNGRGFPDNLAQGNISLTAQIISAASLYDHLLYVEKIPMASMAEHIQQARGYQLSPQIVDILLEVHLARIQKESHQKDKSVLLKDLKEGMVLSRDVLMRSGAFVMPEGHPLDHGTIEKLKDYEKLGNINDTVFVYK
jgi:response regulator RpfG family c-di-GMP phosphodiesterase